MTDETSLLVPEARLLYDIDDAVCEYENDTLKASALMTLISQLDHECGGAIEGFTNDTEPLLRLILDAAQSFENAGAMMCKRFRDAETVFHDAPTVAGGAP